MKIVTIERAGLLHCCTKFQLDISSRLWIIAVRKLVSRAHTPIHTHTLGCQLILIFPDVLDHSEYSDTNIRIFFSRKHSFLSEEAKACESGFPYCSITGFTKFFLWGSMLLDFGFLREKASWRHRIWKIWCHVKEIKKFNFV